MIRRRLFCSVAAVALIAASSALAPAEADEPFDWSGLYLGGHVGSGEANYEGIYQGSTGGVCVVSSCDFARNLDLSGVAGGVQGGYNWQFNDRFGYGRDLVLGFEVDATFMDWADLRDGLPSTSDGISGKVDLLASARARAGIAFNDVLLFASGGVAIADANYKYFDSGVTETIDFSNIGGVLTAGAAWAATDRISVTAEGIYYFFDDRHDTSGGPGYPVDFVEFQDAWVARIGVNVKLGEMPGGY